MPTDNPRITFAVSEEMKDRINDYQFSNRIKNQSQAILSLIKIGMDSLEEENTTLPIVPTTHELSEALYVSKPSGDMKADEIRKFLHETIDQLSDDDLIFFKDFTLRMKK